MADILTYKDMAYADRFGYALKADHKTLIHIDEVNDKNRHEGYFCLSCGEELTPVLGKQRVHHFRHKEKNPNRECNYESYLHKLGKAILLYRFQNSKEFKISIPAKNTCEFINKCNLNCPKDYIKTTNLKDYYDTATEEGTIGKFRADVLLSCSDESKHWPPTLLEICVSHPCTQEKIDSKYRIIEFVIHNEFDACNLLKKEISSRNPFIRFYNFKKDLPSEPKTLFRRSLVNVENNLQIIEDSIDCMKIHTGEYQMLENSVYDVIYKCNLNEQERFDWFFALLVHNKALNSCNHCNRFRNCSVLNTLRLQGYRKFDPVQLANQCNGFSISPNCERYLQKESVFYNVITHSATQQNPQ